MKPYWRGALLSIVIIGFCEIVMHQIFYQSGYIFSTWSGYIIFMVLLFVYLIVMATLVLLYKRWVDYPLDAAKIFFYCSTWLIIARVSLTAYDYFFHNYQAPTFYHDYAVYILKEFPRFAKKHGYTKEEIQAQMKRLKQQVEVAKQFDTSFLSLLWIRFRSSLIPATVIGVILGLLLRDTLVFRNTS